MQDDQTPRYFAPHSLAQSVSLRVSGGGEKREQETQQQNNESLEPGVCPSEL